MATELRIPPAADMHVHLRQDAMMRTVTPHVAAGGVSICYVMPNLIPPIVNTEQALAYHEQLSAIAPEVTFLMSLYLSLELTPDEIRKAKKAGIVGVKSYPRGVTTNSEFGIESYEIYYPIFEAMEEEGMILNLHGEVPSDDEKDICILNAETSFLPELVKLHKKFPKLRIILEHVTTKAAVDMVKSLGTTVAATITIHHLQLTVNDWAGQAHNYCKPVAKYPHDRQALRDVIAEGHSRFFLGSDSAPHPSYKKEGSHANAGVFTTPLVLPYLATILDSFGSLDRLRGFACEFGREFYGVRDKPYEEGRFVMLKKVEPGTMQLVPQKYGVLDAEKEEVVIPFLAGKEITWKIGEGF